MKAIKEVKLKIYIEKKNDLFDWIICADRNAGISCIKRFTLNKKFLTVESAKKDFTKFAKLNDFTNYEIHEIDFSKL